MVVIISIQLHKPLMALLPPKKNMDACLNLSNPPKWSCAIILGTWLSSFHCYVVPSSVSMELVSLNLKTSKHSFVRRRNGGSPQTSSQWRNTCTERHQIDTRNSVHLAPRDDAACQIDQDRVQNPTSFSQQDAHRKTWENHWKTKMKLPNLIWYSLIIVVHHIYHINMFPKPHLSLIPEKLDPFLPALEPDQSPDTPRWQVPGLELNASSLGSLGKLEIPRYPTWN